MLSNDRQALCVLSRISKSQGGPVRCCASLAEEAGSGCVILVLRGCHFLLARVAGRANNTGMTQQAATNGINACKQND